MATEEALQALLGDGRTGDLRADLLAALAEAMRRRERNTAHGGAVIAPLLEQRLKLPRHPGRDRYSGLPRNAGPCHSKTQG